MGLIADNIANINDELLTRLRRWRSRRRHRRTHTRRRERVERWTEDEQPYIGFFCPHCKEFYGVEKIDGRH